MKKTVKGIVENFRDTSGDPMKFTVEFSGLKRYYDVDVIVKDIANLLDLFFNFNSQSLFYPNHFLSGILDDTAFQYSVKNHGAYMVTVGTCLESLSNLLYGGYQPWRKRDYNVYYTAGFAQNSDDKTSKCIDWCRRLFGRTIGTVILTAKVDPEIMNLRSYIPGSFLRGDNEFRITMFVVSKKLVNDSGVKALAYCRVLKHMDRSVEFENRKVSREIDALKGFLFHASTEFRYSYPIDSKLDGIAPSDKVWDLFLRVVKDDKLGSVLDQLYRESRIACHQHLSYIGRLVLDYMRNKNSEHLKDSTPGDVTFSVEEAIEHIKTFARK